MRDLRTVNMSVGQKAESEKVFKRIGDIDYRNLGTFSKILFNTGKVAVLSGLRVEESSGMTVNVPAGILIQRNSSGENFPVVMTDDILVTMDAASGVARTDIIECQVKSVAVKDDYAQSILDSETGVISMEPIKRDIKYYLDARKKTGSTTPTAATAASLVGTAEIISSVDLSSRYIINLVDGEDGNAIEIDLRGATPEATTKAEIVAAINAAIGRTGASVSGNYIAMTGDGSGIQSFFEFKPPVTDTDLDCLDLVFGLAIGGLYSYQYHGSNDWFKICEIDVDTASIVITNAMIRNIDEKSTWASDAADTYIGLSIHNADLLDGYHSNPGTIAGTVPVRDSNGKLPGNITGDAATVGGVSEADFEHKLQTITVAKARRLLSGINVESIVAAGSYTCDGTCTNLPTAEAYYLDVDVYASSIIAMVARRTGNKQTYLRYKISGTWDTAWTQVTDSSGVPWLGGTTILELGNDKSGNRNSYVDFHNADSPSDYTARIGMGSGGTNLIFRNNAGGYHDFDAWIQATRGFKNTLYAVNWSFAVNALQEFNVYQPIFVYASAASNTFLNVRTNASWAVDDINNLVGGAIFALTPGRYKFSGVNLTNFQIARAPSQTASDVIEFF